jgi:sialic acid synthase
MQIEISKNRFVGEKYPPFVMAEVGINHNGDFETAKNLIYEAAKAGADAVKFQRRTIDEMYTEKALSKPYLHENSFGLTYGEHKKYLEFNDNELIELKKYADENSIIFSVSGFDFSGFEFIEKNLDVPFHKIASPLVTHFPLLEYVASFGKPLVISTGMHEYSEIENMIRFVKPINDRIILLQCTTSYPTEDDDVHLNVIKRFKEDFQVLSGYSSHDRGVILPAVSVAAGGCFIEKHFTFDRMAKGPDHKSSVEPRGLELIVKYSKSVYLGLGNSTKALALCEVENKLKHGYSCVSAAFIKAGNELKMSDILFKQPGGGILPKDFQLILNRKLKNDVNKDHTFSINDFQE